MKKQKPKICPANHVYLTVEDMQQRFRLSRSSVIRAAANGDLPKPVKIGRLLRWQKAIIDKFEAEILEDADWELVD